MPDVKSGLTGAEIETGPPSDDEILDATFAKAARDGGSAPTQAPTEEVEPDVPAGRGKDAPQHRDAPTRDSGRAVKLPPDELARFLEPAESTDVAKSLRFGPEPKPEPTPRSGRELADEQIARQSEIEASDPGWQSWRERQSEGVGDSAELLAHRVKDAFQEENDALIMARAREFLEGSPAAYNEWVDSEKVNEIEEAEELGDEEFDEGTSPWNVFDANVRESLAQERAQAQYAQATAKVEGLVGRNIETYERRLTEAGLAPVAEDEQSISRYVSLANWIEASSGIKVGELAYGDPEAAATYMQRANEQISEWDSSLRREVFQREILEADDRSVSSGLETGEQRTAALLSEQNDLLRQQAGLDPAGAVPVPSFNPAAEVPPTRREIQDRPMTVGSFRQGLVEGEGIKAKGAFTKGGKPVSFEEAAFDPVAAENDRRARIRAAGLR